MSHDQTPPNRNTVKGRDALRELALGFPGAWEDHPWGETAIKVRKKVFLFMGASGAGLGLSVKLPDSAREALLLPFTEPTGYGLGKSGWVSARFGPAQKPPLATLAGWIEESYRALAPKKCVALLDGPQAPQSKPAGARRRAPKAPVRKKA